VFYAHKSELEMAGIHPELIHPELIHPELIGTTSPVQPIVFLGRSRQPTEEQCRMQLLKFPGCHQCQPALPSMGASRYVIFHMATTN
jgi:hypothetical protein